MADHANAAHLANELSRLRQELATWTGLALSDQDLLAGAATHDRMARILEELEALAALPSEEELLERLREAEPFAMKGSSAKIIRKNRDTA